MISPSTAFALLAVSAAVYGMVPKPAAANSLHFNRTVFSSLQKPIETFEKRYGPPVQDFGRSRVYWIGDCRFDVVLSDPGDGNGNAVVMAIRMTIQPKKCDIIPIYLDPPRKVSSLKMKDFYGLGFREQFANECLVGCGNGYDPSLAYLSLLPMALGGYTLRIETMLPSDVITTIAKANRQPGSPTINYDYNLFTEAFKAMSAAQPVTSYQEGYDFMTAFKSD